MLCLKACPHGITHRGSCRHTDRISEKFSFLVKTRGYIAWEKSGTIFLPLKPAETGPSAQLPRPGLRALPRCSAISAENGCSENTNKLSPLLPSLPTSQKTVDLFVSNIPDGHKGNAIPLTLTFCCVPRTKHTKHQQLHEFLHTREQVRKKSQWG